MRAQFLKPGVFADGVPRDSGLQPDRGGHGLEALTQVARLEVNGGPFNIYFIFGGRRSSISVERFVRQLVAFEAREVFRQLDVYRSAYAGVGEDGAADPVDVGGAT